MSRFESLFPPGVADELESMNVIQLLEHARNLSLVVSSDAIHALGLEFVVLDKFNERVLDDAHRGDKTALGLIQLDIAILYKAMAVDFTPGGVETALNRRIGLDLQPLGGDSNLPINRKKSEGTNSAKQKKKSKR